MTPLYIKDTRSVISIQGIRYAVISEDGHALELSFKHMTKTIFYESAEEGRATFKKIQEALP